MPTTVKQLRSQLGLNNKTYGYIPETITNMLPTWHKIGKPSPLFTKIEDQKIEMLREKYGGQQETNGKVSAVNKSSDESITSLEAAITKQVSIDLLLTFLNMRIVSLYILMYFFRAI